MARATQRTLHPGCGQDGFKVLVTSDKNIRHQNWLGGLRIVVLERDTQYWRTLQRHARTVAVALADPGHGEHRRVAFPRPSLVRPRLNAIRRIGALPP